MMTSWIAHLYFFIPVAAITTGLKNAVANALVNNGSLETGGNELKMFNKPIGLSATGSPPAVAYGWNFPVKPAMRTAIQNLVTAVPSSRYYVVANTNVPGQGWVERQLLATDSPNLIVGTMITWQDALADIHAITGLIMIGQ